MQVGEDGPGSAAAAYARDQEDNNDEDQQQQQDQTGVGSEGGGGGSIASGEDEQDPQKRVATVQVQSMEGDWRAYCEHPLSVATAAMLNLQQQHQVTAVAGHPGDDPGAGYVYEYYTKLPDKPVDVKLPPTHELWTA